MSSLDCGSFTKVAIPVIPFYLWKEHTTNSNNRLTTLRTHHFHWPSWYFRLSHWLGSKMRTATILAVSILLRVSRQDIFVHGNVRDVINRIFRRGCNAFVIHQSKDTPTVLLKEGMIIQPSEISQWEIEVKCTNLFTFGVKTVLSDMPSGEIIRAGNDRTRRNGFFLNSASSSEKRFTNVTADLMHSNHTYCLAVYINGGSEASNQVCFQRGPTMIEVVEEFKKLTFVPGNQSAVDETNILIGDVDYNMVANFTTNSVGVVSLAAAKSLISNVSCSNDGSVTITFNAKIAQEHIIDLFPVGSILTIEGNELGSCYLGFDDPDQDEEGYNFTYWTSFFPDSSEDGYIVIDDVLQLSDEIFLIRGPRASFLMMFEELDLSMEPIDIDSTNSSNANRKLVKWGDSINRSWKKDTSIKSRLLELTTGAQLNIFAGIQFRISFKLKSGISLTVSLEYELSFIPFVEIAMKGNDLAPKESINDEYPFLSVPLFAIPEISILEKLKLTSPKLGFYFDVAFFLKFDLEVRANASIKASKRISTGRKRLEYEVKGGWGGLKSDVRISTMRQPVSSDSTLTTNVPESLYASANIFTGIQPGLWIYLFGIGRAGVFQRSGLEFSAKGAARYLPPVIGNIQNTKGPCNICHALEVAADAKLENLSYEIKIKFKIDLKVFDIKKSVYKTGTLPGELRSNLFTGCALGNEELSACSTKCCLKGFVCMDGKCQCNLVNSTCAPTPPPTPSPGTWNGACRGSWPDPGQLGNCTSRGGCRTVYGEKSDFNELSGDIDLTHYLPGDGQDYSCRYKTMNTSSSEGGCAGIVPKFADVTVMALSKYRKLSPCHIQTAWIVSSTYNREQYGYPTVLLAPENSAASSRNWNTTYAGSPSKFCPRGVKEWHSFVCFYYGYCNVAVTSNAYTNCYFLNGTHVGSTRRAGSACDYTACV